VSAKNCHITVGHCWCGMFDFCVTNWLIFQVTSH